MGNRSEQNLDQQDKKKQKETMKIAKFVRFNVPTKKCKLRKEEYDYFTAVDAIDGLYKSKFRQSGGEDVPRGERKTGQLYTRDDCTMFFKHLIHNRMAARCMKKYKEDEVTDGKSTKAVTEGKSDSTDKKSTDKSKKRKYKVVGHPHQGFFDDSEEVYIWLWNPTPFMHWIYGCGVLLIVIGGTLFPLWPDTLRTGVYYTSISLAGFIGGILVIGLLRTILFGMIWGATGGKHNLWILPNLLADVGFWESFVPVYTYDIYDSDGNKIKASKKKQAIEGEAPDSSGETSGMEIEDKKDI